jgi:3-deoxy-7-phosphoheptulonate synthase
LAANSSPLVVPALQQPDWPDDDHLRHVCDRLAADVAPVDFSSCRTLRDEMARAGSGDGFLLIGGDCAELFGDATPARVIEKADHLHQIADSITTATGLRTTRIGRFGGQFAKPRSRACDELPDGQLVPSYRGDAVNGLAIDQRCPDPGRLLIAHRCTSDAVHALRRWDARRRETAISRRRQPPPRTYLSHEALLLDYERALLRHEGRHASSGHYLWIGDRTRHPDHAHIAFAASIDNPVGVKLGPSVEPAHVRALVDSLDPERERRPGRLSFIVRMGAARCATLLPPVIEALGARADDVLWILDPMHGNGRTNIHGQKTRLLTELRQEIRTFFAVVSQHGLRPAGIHLEMTPDDVTECVDNAGDLTRWLPAYRSACDPRLNAAQAGSVAELVAELLRSHRLSGSPRGARLPAHRSPRTAQTQPSPRTGENHGNH